MHSVFYVDNASSIFMMPGCCAIVRGMKNNILNRRMRYVFNPSLVPALIAVNFIVFCLTYFLFPRLMYFLAMIPSAVLYGHSYWQFATYIFCHGGMWHLLMNMLALYIFGMPVSREIGSNEFLLFYLLTGIAAGVMSFLTYLFAGYNVMLIGASGAIYGVMLLFSVFYPRSVIYVFGIIPVRAPLLIVIYFMIEFLGALSMRGGIAHATHLWGLVFAFLYCMIRLRIKPWKAWSSL